MNMSLGTLTAHLRLDSSGFNTQFSKLEKTMNSVSRKLSQFGTTMSMAFTVPLTLIGRDAVKSFAAFDEAITQSMAVMTGATESMRGGLESVALELSTRVATSATDLARGYFQLGQAGLSVQKSIALLPVVERFAYAGTMNLSTSIKYLTKSQRALGMEMEDPIENMKQMTRVSDNLTYAAIESTAEIVDFSEAMKNAGPMLRVLGKEIEEGTAALMALANQGHVGSEAGTQLYMVYRDLQRAFITHESLWDSARLSIYDTAGEMLNLSDIIIQLEKNFDGLSDQQVRTQLMLLGFQDRSLRATQAILGMGKYIKDTEAALKMAGGTTEKVTNQYLKAFTAQIAILRNKLFYLKEEIGEILGKRLLSFASTVDGILTVWKRLSRETKEYAVTVGLVTASLGPLAFGLGLAVKIAGYLVTTMRNLVIATLAYSAASPIGVVNNLVSSFGALYGAMSKVLYMNISQIFVGIAKGIMSVGVAIASSLGGLVLFGAAIYAIRAAWDKNINGIRDRFKWLMESIQEGLKWLWDSPIGKFLQYVTDGFREAFSIIKSQWKDFVIDSAAATYASIKWMKVMWEGYKNAMNSATWEGFGVKFANAYKNAKTEFAQSFVDVYDPIKGSVDDATKYVHEKFVDSVVTMRAFGQATVENLESLFEAMKIQAGEDFDSIIEYLKSRMPDLTSAINEAYANVSPDSYKGIGPKQFYAGPSPLVNTIATVEEVKAPMTEEEGLQRAHQLRTMEALNKAHQERLNLQVKIYKALGNENELRRVQTELLEDQNVLNAGILDNEKLAAEYLAQQKKLLEANLGVERLQKELEMNTLLKDANASHLVRLELLKKEELKLREIVKDEELITAYLKRQKELIDLMKDKEGQNPFKGFMAGLKEAQINLKTLGQLGADIAETSINGISDSIWDAVDGTKSLNEGLREVGKTIGDMIAKQAIQGMTTMIMGAAFGAVGGGVAKMFGSAAGGSTGGDSSGGYQNVFYEDTGKMGMIPFSNHAGGIVGMEGKRVFANAALFRGAVKAHDGLMSDEVPIIAQKGEGVFTPGQMKALGNRGGMSDELLSQILAALQDRQTLNATIVDSREVVTKDMFAGREGEAMVMRHVSRNPQNG